VYETTDSEGVRLAGKREVGERSIGEEGPESKGFAGGRLSRFFIKHFLDFDAVFDADCGSA